MLEKDSDTAGVVFFFPLNGLPHWPSELPFDLNPGHWRKAKLCKGSTPIFQSCWNNFFSCGSCIDYFCFICKVGKSCR